MTKVNIEDARNYKKCAKKSYEVSACIPAQGTLIINKLEQAALYKKLGNKSYFTAEQVAKNNLMNKYANEIKSGAMYLADGKTVCLCGTVGEMWLTKLETVVNTYTLSEGNPVTQDVLLRGWRKLKTKATFGGATNFACFVPVSQKGQIKTSRKVLSYNDPLTKHGKGDFIVCTALPNGKPNLADRWVLNGEVFATTYNNTGFTDCLSVSVKTTNNTIDTLPTLVAEKTVEVNKEEQIRKKIETIVGLFQAYYKFDIVGSINGVKDKYGKEFNGKTLVHTCHLNVNGERIIVDLASKIDGTSPIVMEVWALRNDKEKTCYFPSKVKKNQNGELKCLTPVTQLNCKEAVEKEIKAKTFDDFFTNKVKETVISLKPNGLFKKYISQIKKEIPNSKVKPNSTIEIYSGVEKIANLPSNVAFFNNFSRKYDLSKAAKESYEHFVGSEIPENAKVFAKKCKEYVDRVDTSGTFKDLDVDSFYKNIILKGSYEYAFYTTIRANKNAEIADATFCAYLVMEYTNKKGKSCCLIAKISDGNRYSSSSLKDCYAFDYISVDSLESSDYYDFEHTKFIEVSKWLLSKDEQLKKEIKYRTQCLCVIDCLCDTDISGRRKVSGSYSLDVITQLALSPNFFTTELEDYYKLHEATFRHTQVADIPNGDFVLGDRLFSYIFLKIVKQNSLFFELHPIKNIRYECVKKFRSIIELKDTSFIQVIFTDNLKIEYKNTNGKVLSRVITQHMLDECYTLVDKFEKQSNKDDAAIENLYKKLSETKFGKTIEYGFNKFITPRKPTAQDCIYIFNEFRQTFTSIISTYGINILKPFKNEETDLKYDDIMIDGDNDNQLSLHFSLDLDKNFCGIQISGKTNKGALKRTYTIIDEKSRVKFIHMNELIVQVIEKDICDYLGVSKWKKFCLDKYLKSALPFEINIAKNESTRRSRIVAFDCSQLNTKFQLKYTTESLEIRAKVNGISQIFQDKLAGDITENTSKEFRNKLINIALNGVKNELSRKAILAIVNYDSKDRDVTPKVLLSHVTKIEDNVLYFEKSGYNLKCIAQQDGTFRIDCELLDKNDSSITIKGLPVIIHSFNNTIDYRSSHGIY